MGSKLNEKVEVIWKGFHSAEGECPVFKKKIDDFYSVSNKRMLPVTDQYRKKTMDEQNQNFKIDIESKREKIFF